MDAAVLPGCHMVTTRAGTLDDVRRLLATVTDPEIPVLTIEDIGILRGIDVLDDGRVQVQITPTYSGCPAMEVIKEDIQVVLADAGYDAEVTMTFMPAWTTEWMSDEGKRKLSGFGIAPPRTGLTITEEVLCPQCGSGGPQVVSEFGSTACKRLLVCTTCGEPFDHFKEM
jgi:ring-1,2-phenylacetyl-CoA epoxidase subunit PaaD